MHDDTNTGVPGAHVVHVLRQEPLMNRAMTLPKNYSRLAYALGPKTAVDQIRIPDSHLVERDTQVVSGVASKMLVGQEKQRTVYRESALECTGRTRRWTNHSTPIHTERFNRRREVHVQDGR